MAKFKKGDAVVQIVPVIRGIVSGYGVCQETGDTQTLVKWTDTEGEPRERWFLDSEIEADEGKG